LIRLKANSPLPAHDQRRALLSFGKETPWHFLSLQRASMPRSLVRPFVQIDVVNRALCSSRNAISVLRGALIARPCTARLARVCVLIPTLRLKKRLFVAFRTDSQIRFISMLLTGTSPKHFWSVGSQ
jgi:hypothetical protein